MLRTSSLVLKVGNKLDFKPKFRACRLLLALLFKATLLDFVSYYSYCFSATGCPDKRPPVNGWVQRQGTEVKVGCFGSTQSLTMNCTNGSWVGYMPSCVGKTATGSGKSQYVFHNLLGSSIREEVGELSSRNSSPCPLPPPLPEEPGRCLDGNKDLSINYSKQPSESRNLPHPL